MEAFDGIQRPIPRDRAALPWVPWFTRELLDQTALQPEGVAGGLKGRITQLLMMLAFDRHVDTALQLAAQLLPFLDQAAGGVDEFRRFALYLMATQEYQVIETFREALRHQGLEEGDEIMTYAQQLLAEGEAKGRMENQIEMVEGLLRVGVTWDVIKAATGLTENSFQKLKAQRRNCRVLIRRICTSGPTAFPIYRMQDLRPNRVFHGKYVRNSLPHTRISRPEP